MPLSFWREGRGEGNHVACLPFPHHLLPFHLHRPKTLSMQTWERAAGEPLLDLPSHLGERAVTLHGNICRYSNSRQFLLWPPWKQVLCPIPAVITTLPLSAHGTSHLPECASRGFAAFIGSLCYSPARWTWCYQCTNEGAKRSEITLPGSQKLEEEGLGIEGSL